MDEHWSYKNFNMVVELDIAGEFIYNGIHEIYRVSHFANDGSTFTALYDTSDRIMLMDAFANSNVWYEYPEIEKAGQLIAEVISNPQSVYSVVPLLKQCKEYISEEEIVDTIDKGIKILNEHQEGKQAQ